MKNRYKDKKKKSKNSSINKQKKSLSEGSPNRLYAKNLPWGMTESAIKEFFIAGYNVHNVYMILDHKGRFTGCAFFNVKNSNRAITVYNGMEWLGRKLYLGLAKPKIDKKRRVKKNIMDNRTKPKKE